MNAIQIMVVVKAYVQIRLAHLFAHVKTVII